MMRILQSIVVLLTILASGVAALPPRMAHAATQAVPGTDPNFYKLAVSQSGMIQVTYEALAAAGAPVGSFDPATIQIYEQGVEIARTIVDGGDGFGPGDYVLFYGRAVDTLFTATNIYWLTYGSAPGKIMTTRAAPPDLLLPPATSYTETLHIEENRTWQSSSPLKGDADRWYWQYFGPVCADGLCSYYAPFTFAYTATLTSPAPGAFTAGLTPRLRGKGNVTHLATFYVNNTTVGQASWPTQDEFLGTLNFNQALLVNGSNVLTFTVQLLYTDPSLSNLLPKDDGYLNWLELAYQRSYVAPASGQFAFAGEGAAPTSLTLTGLTDSATQVYDVSDPINPQRLTGAQLSGSGPFSLAFTHNAGARARYIAAAPGQFLALTGASISADIPSNLRNSTQGADWIAITPAAFRTATVQLADRRTAQGLRTAVVDIQDVYDEFNGGLPDQEALRRFIRYAYENWPRPAPRYVILMGDGHIDPRNYLGTSPTSWIPPYLAPVDKVDGVTDADNRYVALDPVAPIVNPMPFMALGRLPANTLADAQAMVNKIMAYETAAFDPTWNYKAVFVADAYDPLAGNFAESSDKVAVGTAHLPAEYSRQQIYYSVPPYTTSTAVRNAIIAAINSGALLVNYHGHGSTQSWGGSALWRTTNLSSLTNTGRYPIMLPMTCMEGYFILPTQQSLGESIVRIADKGAVASWSPTGKGIVAGHDIIFTAFYDAIFKQGITELGPVTTYAKQAMYDNTDPGVSLFKDLIDTYILFGDPAMSIQTPTPDVALTVQQNPQNVTPGQTTTYILTYQNLGVVTATQVIITDTLPAELTSPVWTASDGTITALPGPAFTWQLPDLPPGVSGTITLTAMVRPDLPAATAITNTISISADGEPLSRRDDNIVSAQGSVFFPTGFALESFAAFWRQPGVQLTWDTRNESGLVGFNLYRSNSPAEMGKRLNQGLILPSAPPDGSGHYAYLDAGIAPGQRVYYWLEIVMADLSVTVPAMAPRWPNQVYLPLSQSRAIGRP